MFTDWITPLPPSGRYSMRCITAAWDFSGYSGKTADDMRVDVTIGVPKPEAVDGQAVLETLPHGTGHIKVVHGGLQVLNAEGTDGPVIANAIVIVSLDDGK
jgi:uncharacterized protein (TIGR02058 family)